MLYSLVIFQTLPDLVQSCSQFNPAITEFDCSVFTGEYVTGAVDADYLSNLENRRNDSAKTKLFNGVEVIGCSGPMNGADDAGRDTAVGLAPSMMSAALGPSTSDTDLLGLANSYRDLLVAQSENGRPNGVH